MQASSLRRRRITGAHAFFLGALLALFALAPAILPYGGRFVTRGDFIEQQLPFILETPNDDAGYAQEIALLRELQG